MNIIFIKWIIG